MLGLLLLFARAAAAVTSCFHHDNKDTARRQRTKTNHGKMDRSGCCARQPTFLACAALVARFTHAGAMTTMTLQRVLLDAATLLGAARAEGPLRTR